MHHGSSCVISIVFLNYDLIMISTIIIHIAPTSLALTTRESTLDVRI